MPATAESPRKFHFGLTVADLDRAVEHYRVLFNTEPVKHFDDYAKFDVNDPPVVLALHPGTATSSGVLNHVGFRVADSQTLVSIQERLELSGIRTKREEGVECCYAMQTKFWVPDADRHLWEIYTLHEDLDHSGFGGEGHGMPPRPIIEEELVVWEHMLTSPPPQRIPHDDESVDVINLEGTFNADHPSEIRSALLRESLRVLRPGGRIHVHGLVGNAPFPGRPYLPGPAGMVQRIPVQTEPLDELNAAGFVGLNYEKLGDIHCFSVNGVELRELRLTGMKPLTQLDQDAYFVLYRGPLAEVQDDSGRTYIRGERVQVDDATWRQFRAPPFAEHFTCFPCTTIKK